MRALLTLSLAFVALSACAEQRPRSVESAVVRLAAVPGNPSAAYFTLHAGPVDDRLMSVSSPLALRAEMHDMKMTGAMMSMTPLDAGLEVKAGTTLKFESGGKHVMLFDVSPKAQAGRKLPLTLTFASGATLETQADIKAAGQE
ncbi:MAG: copper chaperone PCu(A)C [Sphingomonadaceae bacterium]